MTKKLKVLVSCKYYIRNKPSSSEKKRKKKKQDLRPQHHQHRYSSAETEPSRKPPALHSINAALAWWCSALPTHEYRHSRYCGTPGVAQQTIKPRSYYNLN